SSSTAAKTDLDIENEDPELARYLNREYWEQRSQSFGDYEPSPSPSAPTPTSSSNSSAATKVDNESKLSSQNKFALQDDAELENFMKNLQSTIEIFVNRLQSNKLRGRPITNDSGVQALFMNLTNMHSHLMMYMQQTSESRSNCERLQDKIQQIRDARAALDALRDEHREQLKRAAIEAERLRQQQMAQKLDIMRKQKQQYLQYQRELAIQRMQEQERELMMRTELLKFGTTNPASIPQPQMQWNSTAAMSPYHPHQQTYHNGNYQPATSHPHGMMVANQPPSQMMAQPPPPPTQFPPASMPDQTGGVQNSMIPQHSYYIPQPQHQQPAVAPTGYMPQQQQQQSQTIVTNNGYPPVQYGVGGMQQQPPPQSQQHPEQPQQQPEPIKEQVKEELLINFD
ncbi:hypothetical protein BLA29_004661, partial [Euroglyphus maynei]